MDKLLTDSMMHASRWHQSPANNRIHITKIMIIASVSNPTRHKNIILIIKRYQVLCIFDATGEGMKGILLELRSMVMRHQWIVILGSTKLEY